MSSFFTDAQKRELVDVLVSKGARREEATIAMDLAIHAQEEAIRTFSDRLKAAPNGVILMSAFQMGSMIAGSRFDSMGKKAGDLMSLLNMVGDPARPKAGAGSAA